MRNPKATNVSAAPKATSAFNHRDGFITKATIAMTQITNGYQNALIS